MVLAALQKDDEDEEVLLDASTSAEVSLNIDKCIVNRQPCGSAAGVRIR
jgi:hypothetical protein